ncbi:MAG: type II toxin-antitoxin system YafQ family toxin [Gammaproteobacteria bacterium]|nr:type II toxin-antitoxin system YafQ family toxin [Gammaproteobacteria bacterium]
MDKLVSNEPLDKRNRPHDLFGYWADCRECYIEPDGLLIWREDERLTTLIESYTCRFIWVIRPQR